MLKRKLTAPAQFQSLDGNSPFLKAHMHDGKVYILSSWKTDSENRTVTGQGKILNVNRETLKKGKFAIPIDSVAIFETNVLRTFPGTGEVAGEVAAGLIEEWLRGIHEFLPHLHR